MAVRPLSAGELLDCWERGWQASPPQRALLLLAAAAPETGVEALARLPIGRRDALLLTLREGIFGPRLLSIVNCPACGERLEFSLDSQALRGQRDDLLDDRLSVMVSGYFVEFRLPNTLDVEAGREEHDLATFRHAMLERCLIRARRDVERKESQESLAVEQLPAAVLEAVTAAMEEADPLADICIDLTCPACSQHWPAIFDIADFFWREIDDWARRILRAVHTLAAAYGWSEREILSMSAWRRSIYLEMVEQ
jgi:uncharacterized protein YbaR (Trm112 family)